MNILITGISGFVGKYLLQELLATQPEANISGTYLDEKELGNLGDMQDKIELHFCNIVDREQVKKVIEKSNPDQIYHLAGVASAASKNQDMVFTVNIDGSLNIIKTSGNQEKKVKILLASTGYVYGAAKDDKSFTEADEVNPLGIYAKSKAEMEKQARDNKPENVELLTTRAFNQIGPEQTPAFVVPAFAQQIAKIEAGQKDTTILVGNLEATRDFFDIRDAVKAYQLIMNESPADEIYNLASGQGVKISEILNKLLTLSPENISIKQDKDRMRASDLAYSVGDCSKIKKSLGWSPEITLEQTLEDTLNYWREQTKAK